MGKVVPIIGVVLLVLAAVGGFLMQTLEAASMDASTNKHPEGKLAYSESYEFTYFLGGFEETKTFGGNVSDPGPFTRQVAWADSEGDGVSNMSMASGMGFLAMVLAIVGAILIIVGFWTPRLVGLIGGILGIVAFLLFIVAMLVFWFGLDSQTSEFVDNNIRGDLGWAKDGPVWNATGGLTMGGVAGLLAVIGGGMGLADPRKGERQEKEKKERRPRKPKKASGKPAPRDNNTWVRQKV